MLDTTLTDPPASPAEGDRYIVASGGTDAWDGEDGNVATFVDGAWAFAVPAEGWLAYDLNSETVLVFLSGVWTAAGLPTTVDHLGINATADATSRLAVRSASVLFAAIEAADGGSGDIRFTVSKETESDTASLLFQDGFAGRAEVGLAGDDDFVFKVSPDGTTWVEAIRIDKDTGLPSVLYDNGASGLSATTVQDAIDEVVATGGGGGGAAAGVNADITSLSALVSLDGGPIGRWRNLLINADGQINQRAPASNADDTYGHDRWYALTQTGSIAVSTVADAEDGTPFMWRLTQSQASAQRMAYAQIVKASRCKGLRGRDIVLGGRFRCSAAQAIRYAILEWTGTADAVTSDVVNDWTSGTYTAGNFFIASNLTVRAIGSITPSAATLTDLGALTATLGSTFTNLIVVIWTEGTAAQNVTLDGALQFEPGAVATQRELWDEEDELMRCLPYCRKMVDPALSGVVGGDTRPYTTMPLIPPMRASGASITLNGALIVSDGLGTVGTASLYDVGSTTVATRDRLQVAFSGTSGLGGGRGCWVQGGGGGNITLENEL